MIRGQLATLLTTDECAPGLNRDNGFMLNNVITTVVCIIWKEIGLFWENCFRCRLIMLSIYCPCSL